MQVTIILAVQKRLLLGFVICSGLINFVSKLLKLFQLAI